MFCPGCRYEDLCLQWNTTLAALESWEPLLHGMRKHAENPPKSKELGLRRVPVHEHSPMTLKAYCEVENVPKWSAGLNLTTPIVPLTSRLPLGATDEEWWWPMVHNHSTDYLGYAAVDQCIPEPS